MCEYNVVGKTATSTINLVHSKRKGIFIRIKEMPVDPISLRSRRSYLTFRLYWTTRPARLRNQIDILPWTASKTRTTSWLRNVGVVVDVRETRRPGGVRRDELASAEQPAAESLLFASGNRRIAIVTMKLLESTRIEAINSALFIKTGDCDIIGRWDKTWRYLLPEISAFRCNLIVKGQGIHRDCVSPMFAGSRVTLAKWQATTSRCTNGSTRSRELRRTIFKLCHRRRRPWELRPLRVIWGIARERNPIVCKTFSQITLIATLALFACLLSR